MTIGWSLLPLLVVVGYFIRWAQKELNAERFWILPYRERCRRLHPVPRGNGWTPMQCKNQVWRIRWSALAPLSVVCRECRRKDAKVRVGV